jgi:hypothetical protein
MPPRLSMLVIPDGRCDSAGLGRRDLAVQGVNNTTVGVLNRRVMQTRLRVKEAVARASRDGARGG